jgi:hypothetical protein
MKGNSTSLLLFCAISLAAPLAASAAPITVPPGLNPGDKYRLVFVTSTKRDATSKNIDDYNTFVNTAANSVSELAALGTTWKAIASTKNTPAAVNTSTDLIYNPGQQPIYRLDGALVANDYWEFWNGKHRVAIDRNESGSPADDPYHNFTVWTGTKPDGYQFSYEFNIAGPLGGGSTRFGDVKSVMGYYNSFHSQLWTIGVIEVTETAGRLYAMSGPITVVPEPSSFVLAALGLLGLIVYTRRRRNLSSVCVRCPSFSHLNG